MRWFWIVLGVILILAGLLDLYLSALNYEQSGVITLRLQRLLWWVLRGVYRVIPGSWHSFARAQALGLQILLDFVVWLALEILGFGFVYYGLMRGHDFSFTGSHTGPSMDYAVYFSLGQLSTVGPSGVIPETTLLRMLSVIETLIGLGFVTVAITFLFNIFQTTTYLRALATDLHSSSPDASDPVSNLSLYFPHGQPRGLSDYLGRLYQSLGSYNSGLRLHHTAYYFQSRSNYVSIPYVFHTLGGVIGALRWGLPADNPASEEPLITALAREFTAFLCYFDSQLSFQVEEPPPAQPYQTFARVYDGGQATEDAWLNRFLALNQGMRQLVSAAPAPDAPEAYRRYAEWLPFAHRTQQTVQRVARHLDYDLGKLTS